MWGQCGSKFRIGKTRSLSRLVCVPRFSSRSPPRRPLVCFVSSIVPIVRFVSSFPRSSCPHRSSRSPLVSCFALHSPPFLYFYFPSTYFFYINNVLFSTSSFRPVRCYSECVIQKVFFTGCIFKHLVDDVYLENYMVSVPTHAPKNRMLLPLERVL